LGTFQDRFKPIPIVICKFFSDIESITQEGTCDELDFTLFPFSGILYLTLFS